MLGAHSTREETCLGSCDYRVLLCAHMRLQTAVVCQTNRYWQPTVSIMNSGMPTPAVGLQWNMMVDDTVLVFSRPHTDSEGTITSRLAPGGHNIGSDRVPVWGGGAT